MIRTQKVPFLQSRPGLPLLLSTAVIVAIGILIPKGPIAHYLKLQAQPLNYFRFPAALLAGYMLLTPRMKSFCSRRFAWQ